MEIITAKWPFNINHNRKLIFNENIKGTTLWNNLILIIMERRAN